MIGRKSETDLREKLEQLKLERRKLVRASGPFREDAHDDLTHRLEQGREFVQMMVGAHAADGIPLRESHGSVSLVELWTIWSASSDPKFEATIRQAIDRSPGWQDKAAFEKELTKIDRQIGEVEKKLAEIGARRAALEAELAQLGGDAA